MVGSRGERGGGAAGLEDGGRGHKPRVAGSRPELEALRKPMKASCRSVALRPAGLPEVNQGFQKSIWKP